MDDITKKKKTFTDENGKVWDLSQFDDLGYRTKSKRKKSIREESSPSMPNILGNV